MKAYLDELFGPAPELDPYDLGLGIFWGTPDAKEIVNFVWDTSVPQVTDPWPILEPVSIRDAIAQLSGREDVTGFLYEQSELTQLLEAVDG